MNWTSLVIGLIVGHTIGVANLAIWIALRKCNDEVKGGWSDYGTER